MFLRQGDTYELQVNLSVDGSPIQLNEIDRIEWTFGTVRKYYGENGTVTYTAESGLFIIPFLQGETFEMRDEIEYQVRIKFKDGTVRGSDIHKSEIKRSLSRVVL